MLQIPPHLLDIAYVGKHFPGANWEGGLAAGANCQVFAYALLNHYGIVVPPFRSSDLWEDQTVSQRVTDLKPLDLLLWNRTTVAWGAHVGVYLGEGKAVHLSKQIGKPVIWSLARFMEEPLYHVFIGGKRILS